MQVVDQTSPPELNSTISQQGLRELATAALDDALPTEEDLCNAELPTDSVLGRFVWVVDLLARNGVPFSPTPLRDFQCDQGG